MSCDFIAEGITQTKLIIRAYEEAILALSGAGAIEEYMLNTGQSIQKVTRSNLKELNDTLDGLYNRLVMMEARTRGGNVVIAGPAW